MIDRIAKLLNQAERAATPEEAAAFFEKAQALATTHAISLAKARMHTAAGSRRAQPVNKTIRVGEARQHANRHLVLLMSGIAGANDLRMDVAHNSTYVVVYGFADDIAAAEALWTRVATQMVRFGERYLAGGEWRSDTRLVLRNGFRYSAPMTKQTARSTYYGAFIRTVSRRIATAREQAVRAAERADRPGPDPAATTTTTSVALRAKELEVSDFYRSTSEARGTWGGGRPRVVGLSESAEQAGRRDARQVRLTDQDALGGPRRAVGS